ncbi:MAG: hypothetical protein CML20_16510 [Rheinheimera sp.]|nr:hypothetical protein [Rheinheimera sp.]|tara:strand:+ start:129508 stop:129738 length:231 start_codon:yes stop_codon:yes gene_type:complete
MHLLSIKIKVTCKYLIILLIAVLLSYTFRELRLLLLEFYPVHAYWLEKLLLLVFMVLFTIFVMIPFTKLIGMKIGK